MELGVLIIMQVSVKEHAVWQTKYICRGDNVQSNAIWFNRRALSRPAKAR
jgi:hypothetical protein